MALYLNNTETMAFLYRWTQKSTGKWYEGSRTASKCNPNDGYICSSRIVKPLIIENSNDWERTILVIGTPDYIRKLETSRLKQLDAKNDPMSFNRNNADRKFTTLGRIEPQEQKQKRIVKLKGKKKPAGFGDIVRKNRTGMKFNDQWRKNIAMASTGRIQNEMAREKNRLAHLGENNHFYGKHHTDESKIKCGIKNKGVNSGNWNGYWIAPNGEKFVTIREAHDKFPIVACANLRIWCKTNKNGWSFEPSEKVI